MGKVFVCFIRQIMSCSVLFLFAFSSFTFSILRVISMATVNLAYRFDDGVWKSQPLFSLMAIWSALSVNAPHQTIAQATILSLCSQMFLSTCSRFSTVVIQFENTLKKTQEGKLFDRGTLLSRKWSWELVLKLHLPAEQCPLLCLSYFHFTFNPFINSCPFFFVFFSSFR